MNKAGRRMMAAGLCAALCLSGVSAAVSQNAEEPETTVVQTAPVEQTDAQQETFKEETVYVLAGADGSVQKIIVSDWIKNTLGSDTVYDRSNLTNMENVKGDESYTMDSSSMTVWNAGK